MEARVDDVVDHLALRDDGRFRDFDAQLFHRQMIFFDELLQRLCDVEIEEVLRRDVDGARSANAVPSQLLSSWTVFSQTKRSSWAICPDSSKHGMNAPGETMEPSLLIQRTSTSAAASFSSRSSCGWR